MWLVYDSYTSTVGQYRTYPLGFTCVRARREVVRRPHKTLLQGVAAGVGLLPSSRMPSNDFRCALTGDPLFSQQHPHELVEDGLAYSVRGSMQDGINAFAMQNDSLPPDGALPLTCVDVVKWSGLRHVQLDKSGFVKHWQRYIAALMAMVEDSGGDDSAQRADALLLRSHTFACKLMHSFDELDFLVGKSEDTRGPLAVLYYKEEDPLTPHIYFLAEGVTAIP